MSDHLDSPGPVAITVNDDTANVGPPNGDPKTDITDLYAFLKPGDTEDGGLPGKSILILNVNPLAPALANEFESGADYLILVDTNGDAVRDITFSFSFSPKANGAQTATVKRTDAGGSQLIVTGAPVSFGKAPQITVAGPYKFFAGLRSDPFFFDLLGFIDDFNFVHGDFFIDKNVFSMVLEVPNGALGSTPPTTALWARTRIMNGGGGLVNDDRAARAGINTVFNHGIDKNIFNALDPSADRTALNSEGITFLQSFANTVTALSGNAAYGTAIANALLPDVLNYDVSKPTDYAKLNGRRLPDDVIGISLSLITKGGLTTDNVGPHTDYLDHFPYVGTPH